MLSIFNNKRFRIVTTAVLGLAVSFALFSLTSAQSENDSKPVQKMIGRGAFDDLKQIDAGVLNIGYIDSGPRDGRPVILLLCTAGRTISTLTLMLCPY